MILIISHDAVDEPTNNVIDWLNYYEANFKRINGVDFSFKNEILFEVNQNTIVDNNGNKIVPNQISVVWYRRWVSPAIKKINFDIYNDLMYTSDEVGLIEKYQVFLSNELNSYVNGIFSLFYDLYCIPKMKFARGRGLNKINVLMFAKKKGLLIPETIITTSKKKLQEFYKKNKCLITKPISEVTDVSYKGINGVMYTKSIKSEEIEAFPDLFFPSLFQKRIDKAFEVRTFVHRDVFFSMAIFSQRDNQTSVDFRNYNYEKPNRNVPFILPKKIETKLFDLFKSLDLNTGSVDFMVDKKGKFYFLEINPVGQSGMVSIGGNFYLEKIIAEDLIKLDNEKFGIQRNN